MNRDSELEQYADEILEGRFAGVVERCAVRTLSEALRESGWDRLDLLKLDVEKSEWEILSGLRTEDWPKVQQAVVEVHDLDGRLAALEALFAGHGFAVVTAGFGEIAFSVKGMFVWLAKPDALPSKQQEMDGG